MTSTIFRLTAAALTAALSACATSPPPMRIATTQVGGAQVHRDTVQPLFACEAADGGFNAPDAMKLPKDTFGGCPPR